MTRKMSVTRTQENNASQKVISTSKIKTLNTNQYGAMRKGFGAALFEKAKESKDIVVLCADLTDSLKVGDFKNKYPNQYFEMGICEQNMMGAAAGMCINNKKPFVLSYAAFNPGRNFDQMRVSVVYSKYPVTVVGGHAGLTTGEDGATHQALEDIGMVRTLPEMTIVVPCDEMQAKKATMELSYFEKPAYLRLSREKSLSITQSQTSFSIGKAQILDKGNDVAIIACGIAVQFALYAREELKLSGISATVINMHTIRPLDTRVLSYYAKHCGAIVSVEEHQIRGGLGSEISEWLIQNNPIPQEFVGVQDTFGESGKGYELLEKYGISTKEIVKKAKKSIRRKNN